ncbi:MAG: alanine:cation symporter family protein [Bacteroidales bacterium]|nr:alanine:cation symporter family protein [Bacteroidales bacterium]
MKKISFLILIPIFLFLLTSSKATDFQNSQDTTETVREDIDKLVTELIDIEKKHFSQQINDFFEPIVEVMGYVLFWDPLETLGIRDPYIYDDNGNPVYDKNGNHKKQGVPIVVLWLIIGAVFFTFKMRFINIRGFRHSIELIKGKYDKPEDKGEVSHFQALTTALSATVGLGNIASVAIAIAIGGPGATFWMIIAGLFGMSSKFVECSLGVKYRKIDKSGQVSGGPMYYLSRALKKRKLGALGKILAAVFAILIMGCSFGGGNMFQANQAFSQLALFMPFLENKGAYFGIFLAILVGLVIIGGIKSIGNVTEKIVPFMASLYVITALIIIFMNITEIGNVFVMIFNGAFSASAIKGGFIGVLIIGFQRASFSNEAGVGSASIAHSAVRTDEPVSEGIVALLEPFIDTVVICTMTALVIIFTGLHENPGNLEGSQLTSAAFGSVFSWFPYLLAVAIFLFAFSTMISWSYYGLKGFDYLCGGFFENKLGNRKIGTRIFQVIFLGFAIIGASSSLDVVIDFSDMMILSMAFPNILGLLILSNEVKKDLKSYMTRVKNGEIKKFK